MNAVIDILKLGLSGLVFLFALLGYRLLEAEQKKGKPTILAAIYRYLWMCLLSAVLVAVFSLAPMVLPSFRHVDAEPCRDSLSRLATVAKLPDVPVEKLRAAIDTHVERCSTTLAAGSVE